eukprot:546341-Prymnesium_polylepis.1
MWGAGRGWGSRGSENSVMTRLTVLTPSPAGSCPRVRVLGVLSGSMHVGCRSLEGSGESRPVV